jgi:hypothetical protein
MVFGILNIVWGLMGLCSAVFGVVGIVLLTTTNIDAAMEGHVDPTINLLRDGGFYAIFTYVMTGCGFAASIIVVAAGIGLIQFKNFGRSLSNVWGIYAIISICLSLGINLAYVWGPILSNLEAAPEGPQRFGMIGGAIGGLVGSFLGFVYPALLLYFVNRASFVAALREHNS